MDDPNDIPAIAIPYSLPFFLFMGFPVVLLAAFVLTAAMVDREFRSGRRGWQLVVLLGIVPASWALAYTFLRWDPAQAAGLVFRLTGPTPYNRVRAPTNRPETSRWPP